MALSLTGEDPTSKKVVSLLRISAGCREPRSCGNPRSQDPELAALMFTAARRTPVGASAATTAGDGAAPTTLTAAMR